LAEHDEQLAFFEWSEYKSNMGQSDLDFMFAIPNGGWRAIKTAGWLKAEGVKAGVPDIHFPVANGGFHGLYIEMKYGWNKPTEAQEEYIEFLKERGYAVAVCYGFDEAVAVIEWYLNELPTAVVLSGIEKPMPGGKG